LLIRAILLLWTARVRAKRRRNRSAHHWTASSNLQCRHQ
jgi:hypothetical protein